MTMRDQVRDFVRRGPWLFAARSPGQIANVALAAAEYALRREKLIAWPTVLKVDLSPLCNLHCRVCVHAAPDGDPMLEAQRFNASQKMAMASFQRIVDEVRGRTSSLSLYYLGDPLVHRDLDAMCAYAAANGLGTHVSSNLSFNLSDARIASLVDSGLSHLSVAIDGMSQETYERNRVGGKLALVLDNLRRVAERRRAARRRMMIEVQFLRFPYNAHEVERARQELPALGADVVSVVGGTQKNWVTTEAQIDRPREPRPGGVLPRCQWPHFAMVIRYDGDVLPCCTHRISTQYVPGADRRAAGNAFQTSVREVWDSPQYQFLRRLVVNPSKVDRAAGAASFCHGCSRVYTS
jgi:MoaA/NifB/PqqE/SkfB family radical SAM enzyme